ncbi:hypothetical protein, partial [Staphylococcus aureus]
MIRRPPRSTRKESSAASDVYKRQLSIQLYFNIPPYLYFFPVSYTHLRAHETLSDLVCRLLLEKNALLYTSPSPRAMRRA